MINYEEELVKNININKQLVLQDINSQDMAIKIMNWANKFNYSFNEIKNKIINDEIFRCAFIKDPKKQNFYQTLASKYISSLNCVNNFKTLSSGGKNALYVENGKILTGSSLKYKNKETKSIDFMWNTGKYTFYATHKYTKSSGGA